MQGDHPSAESLNEDVTEREIFREEETSPESMVCLHIFSFLDCRFFGLSNLKLLFILKKEVEVLSEHIITTEGMYFYYTDLLKMDGWRWIDPL